MATTEVAYDSGHTDMVHDVQLDYYGKRLATCSSDRTIKVFDVVGDVLTPTSELIGHEGPVWQITWAHPKFGSLLASCSFDHRIIIWKEVAANSWQQVFVSDQHTASVNCIAFAPYELGLMLAAASSDGSVSVLSYLPDGQWAASQIEGAHAAGALAVSWAPAAPPGSLISGKGVSQPEKRLASAGCDNLVKVWRYNDGRGTWEQEGASLTGHTDWVRDVAWAPNLGMPVSTIASAGQDGKVIIWTEKDIGVWDHLVIHDFGAPVWRVSWSVSGAILAVSDSKNNVSLWKESLDGRWNQLP
eukprot:jgi/Botrbrau1/19622/Bobra.0448s0002.1